MRFSFPPSVATGGSSLTIAQQELLNNITVTPGEINLLQGVSGTVQGQLNNKLSLNGGTLTGPLTLADNPSLPMQPATKLYVDNVLVGIDAANKVDKAGDTMTGLLSLSGDPVDNLHAATKQYVDNVLVGIDAANKVDKAGDTMTGLLSLSGDPTANLHAATKQYVDAADSALSIQVTDIQSTVAVLNADPVTKTYTDDKVTTMVAKAGDAMTGLLSLSGNPISSLHAATKQYVDTSIADISSLFNMPVGGTLALYNITTAPTGFLRANGAEVSKTTYSALFTAIGDSYSISMQPGSGKPWVHQYDINLTGDALGAWNTEPTLPSYVKFSQSIITKNRVYILGSAGSATVYTAVINADGTLGAWVLGTALPVTISDSQAIVAKNRIYLIGGVVNGVPSSSIYSAPIDAGGTIGVWSIISALPVTLYSSNAIVTRNRIYMLGGVVSGNPSTSVYTALINVDGTLGTWSTATAIPSVVLNPRVIITKNRIYILGGDGSADVYTVPIDVDGIIGAWVTASPLPLVLTGVKAITTRNRVILIGAMGTANIYSAPINADGTIGTWEVFSSLPLITSEMQVIITSSRVYAYGGSNAQSDSLYVYSSILSGGLNDYSPYYDGTYTSTNPATFRLPDETNTELLSTTNKKYYIKF